MVEANLHQVITLPGRIQSLVITVDNLILVAVAIDWPTSQTTTIYCFDMSGRPIWEREFPGCYPQSLKLDQQGRIWLARKYELKCVSLDASYKFDYPIRFETGEMMGGFVVTPDYLYVCSRVTRHHRTGQPGIFSYERNGEFQWQTRLPVEPIAFAGIVEMGVTTRGKIQPKKAWMPTTWEPFTHQNQLILSGHSVLASYFEYHSGIGKYYALDTEDGRITWVSELLPMTKTAIAGKDMFLISSNGYGANDTWLYKTDGTQVTHWREAGNKVIGQDGLIRCFEPNSFLSVLNSQGDTEYKIELNYGQLSYPAIDQCNIVVFWANGQLIAIDEQFTKQILYTDLARVKGFTDEVLITDDGYVICNYGHELLIFETNLKPLARSAWPCGLGSLSGNPVYL